jgi:hypothetical protein
MMAGRNISATHAAFTSTRVMATCAVIGQAVGTAAAMCSERGITPRQLAQDARLVSRLQQTLLRQDQTIKRLNNADPQDLARTARITASGENGPAKAALVTDGFLRDIPDKKGQLVECHHWSGPMTADGAWLELAWDKLQRISRVQITFDSGFQRELTLSASDSITRGIVRGAQPETVRDFSVSVKKNGSYSTVAVIKENHQRQNRLRFEPAEAQAVRIHIAATNGIEEARIFEVRCYS